MPIRRNGYYNDPAIGAAFDNLAKAFAPPSGTDTYGYARAAAEKAKADRLAEMFSYAKAPSYDQTTADRMGVMGGLYSPNQSYYAVDRNNATSMRNTDATNRTTLDKARMAEEGALARLYAQPVIVGENQTVRLPEQTAAATGLPAMFGGQISVGQGETVRTAAGETIHGRAKPLTDAEVRGAVLSGLPANEQRAVALQGVPLEMIVTQEGPRNVFRPDAVGQTPVIDEAKRSKPIVANYKTTDMQGKPGMTGTAYLNPADNAWYDTQTGAKLPPGAVTYSATLTGDKDGTGLGPTTANTTTANNRAAELQRTLDTLDLYEGLIRNSPGVVGIPGLVRGTAQNAVAVANDVARSFGKNAPQIEQAAADIRQGLSKVAPDYFDPGIPEAQFYQGTLAYALARTENPSGEVSRQAFERALERVRGGVLTNPDQILATIGGFRKVLRAEADAIGTLRDPSRGRTDPNYRGPTGEQVIQTPQGSVTIKRREP